MADILEPVFGTGGVILGRFLIMLLLILAILALALWVIGRISAYRSSTRFSRGHQRRLEILDSVQVDSKRRAVLLRRDDVEHLILIGGPTDVVVTHDPPGDSRARPAERRPDEGTTAVDRRRAANPAERSGDRRPPQRPAGRPPRDIEPPAQRPSPPVDLDQAQTRQPRRQPAARKSSQDTAGASRRDLAVFGGGPPRETPAQPRRPAAAHPGRPPAPPSRPTPPPPGPNPADPYAKPSRPVEPGSESFAPQPPVGPAGPPSPDSWGDAVLRPTLGEIHHDAVEEEEEAAAEFVAAATRPHPSEPGARSATAAAPDPVVPEQPVQDPPRQAPDNLPAPAAAVPPEFSPFPPLPTIPPQHQEGASEADQRVGQLEEEMARLLSEITTRRRAGS